jgi:hypothetical protein
MIKTTWCYHKNTHLSWNKTEIPETNPHNYGYLKKEGKKSVIWDNMG